MALKPLSIILNVSNNGLILDAVTSASSQNTEDIDIFYNIEKGVQCECNIVENLIVDIGTNFCLEKCRVNPVKLRL